VVLPVALALVSLALLVYDHFDPTNLLALALATASIVAMVARLALTHSENVGNLVTSRYQARTDSLTRLGNRFGLLADMELRLAEQTPHVLLLFDLDGFKNYNDSYGHPAGDALLARLGSRLAKAMAADGGAYRIGGDEFCVLGPWREGDPVEPLIARARAALSEEGEGFDVGASCGHALLAIEVHDAAEALRVSDRRLYAEKNSGRVSARVQSARVLRRALDAWDAELGEHTSDVALLAAQVARRLGLDDDEVERVATGAELHDVGKIAIPRSILSKPAALDDEEWAFMRRHTLIGERIAQGAPALVGVAGLIRSSHERWDGGGYPDGLAGDAIPLGAQILFVCDSFSAMTTDRCYKPGMSEAAAAEELQRHAGSQFSPAVVEAFVATRAAGVGTLALGATPGAPAPPGPKPGSPAAFATPASPART
jgi:diguanylate cyclase (GGDEF)-like protein